VAGPDAGKDITYSLHDQRVSEVVHIDISWALLARLALCDPLILHDSDFRCSQRRR